jgi:uncharacterized membrane protein (DUF373 family)
MSGILQNMQNVIVVFLCLLMFWIMVVQIYQTSLETMGIKNFRSIAGHLIYIFVLVELFRLMIHYLEEQRILLGTIIEVTIVSVLREVILEGVLNISWERILALCGLILTLAATLVLNFYMEKSRPKLEQITLPKAESGPV